jgi:plastocyanin
MRRTSRFTSALAAASLLVLVTACGGDDGGNDTEAPDNGEAATAEGGGDSLTVVATEFAFEPVDIELAADQDVELTLENAGVVEHDLTVDELDIEIYVDATESVTETVNVPAGTYEYYCSIPGHRSSGMEGTLTAS